ncbi:MAG: PilZ domain-containing protein [Nitrospirae bacterium]|nr:MAG: PilZ domain-containing protein [Nitrospirota bacterium]
MSGNREIAQQFPNDHQTDKREIVRVPIKSPAVIEIEQQSIQGAVLDLTQVGARLVSEYPIRPRVRPRDYVSLTLSIPSQQPPLQVMLAGVRWAHGGHMGVEFIQMTQDEQGRLREALKAQTN